MHLPETLRPLRRRRYHQDKKAPHDVNLCEKCQELGTNCQESSDVNAADDESVISEYSTTSDSSAASGPALEDVDSDITPVGSEDEEQIDKMVEQLKGIDLKKDTQ